MIRKLAFGLAATVALASSANAATLFGVDVNNNLVRINSNNPSTNISSKAITGLGEASILAMDVRVRDGRLYALGDDKKVYTIDIGTGAAAVFANALPLTGTQFAFDFNPTNANLRIVGNDGQNGFYNFATNAYVAQSPASYGMGAVEGIVGAGYTNNTNGVSATTLFVIDANLDRLATLNVGTGALADRGSLGANFLSRGSFDILTRGSTNSGFAYSGNTLYSVNLADGVINGRLTALGNTSGPLFALTAAIPEPATWGMMILGFGFIGGALRAQKRRWGTLATA